MSCAALTLGAAGAWTYLLTQSIGLGTVAALIIAAGCTGLATAMAIFASGYYSMQYTITEDDLILSSLWIRDVVPLAQIESIFGGKKLGNATRTRGVSWRGLHIGTITGTEVGAPAIYATSLRPASVLILTTPRQAYALTPADLEGFRTRLIKRLEAFTQEDVDAAPEPRREGSLNPTASIRADRLSTGFLAASVALLLAAFAVVVFRLPGLPPSIALHLGPAGTPDFVVSPSEALRLPIAGLLILSLNTAMAIPLHTWQRDAARLLAGSTFFVQLIGLIAILRVVQ